MKTASRIISVIIVLTIAATAKAQFFNPRLNAAPAPATRSNLGRGLRFGTQPATTVRPTNPSVLRAPALRTVVPNQAFRQQILRPAIVRHPQVTSQPGHAVIQTTPQQQVRTVIRPDFNPRFTNQPIAAPPIQTVMPGQAARHQVIAQPVRGRVTTATTPTTSLEVSPTMSKEKTPTEISAGVVEQSQNQTGTLKSVLTKHSVSP